MSEAFLTSLATRFEALEDALNALDAATGDGDHGSTMLKGLRAAAAAPDASEKAFRRAAGGASGSLFAVIIGAMTKGLAGEDFGSAIGTAVDRISMLGQAKEGDKTLLDALIPAAKAGSPHAAVLAAQSGLEATRAMAARRGRAKHVEDAGVGHLDAGAMSVVEMLKVYAAFAGAAK